MQGSEPTLTGAVIAAAGVSRRIADIDKLWAPLGDKPLVARVVDVFQDCPSITQIVLVLNESYLKSGEELVTEQGWSKVTAVCPGGQRRQDSVANGLACLDRCHWVVIHDGARPLVTRELIEFGLEAVTTTGAAAAAVPVTDTIKVAGNDRLVIETPPRPNLWSVQTPQVFHFDIITAAYRRVTEDVTDDATMVERMGHRVQLYMGSYDNIKVTTTEDLALARLLWQRNAE
jgi:2-C-methyl-D-erythritol 4-phosphate cytidylyltransferase